MSDDKVTPQELTNFSLANTLLKPPGRSQFYRRAAAVTLATASLAATAWLATGPPKARSRSNRGTLAVALATASLVATAFLARSDGNRR